MPRSYGETTIAPWASAPAVGSAGNSYWNTATKTLHVSDGTAWVAISGGAGISTPFIIPDPTGASYPALRFSAGDGNNGTGPNTYHYEINLYNDRLWIYSNRQPGRAIADFYRGAADVATFSLQNWQIEAGSDGHLRFFYGADRATSEVAFLSAGGLNTNGRMTSTEIVVSSAYIYGNGVLILSSNGTSYCMAQGASGGAQVISGHQYGVGDYGKTCIVSNSANNDWPYRPLTITATGSAESGLSFHHYAKGWATSMQMFYDGNYYIGILNGANTGYIKILASQFQVVSSARFKDDVERMTDSVRDVIERITPVRYRDLQVDLARAVNTDPPEGYRFPGGMAPKRDEEARRAMREGMPVYRYGIIAEEVAEVLPDLVASSHLGPGLDVSGLVAVLWQAVRELSARVGQLEGAA